MDEPRVTEIPVSMTEAAARAIANAVYAGTEWEDEPEDALDEWREWARQALVAAGVPALLDELRALREENLALGELHDP